MGSSQGVGRHLPSPSGPGSLPPGLITKRRMFDDGSSDISAQSSMMDYTGEREQRAKQSVRMGYIGMGRERRKGTGKSKRFIIISSNVEEK